MIKRFMAMAALCLGIGGAIAASAELVTQKSNRDGVTIAVTPINVGANAKVWDFKVVLDTHSQDLSDDLAKSAVLVDGKGREREPLAWRGAPPGGHHREGVLSFPAFEPLPEVIELRVMRPGESELRLLRWQLR
jgi:hypothetical protein